MPRVTEVSKRWQKCNQGKQNCLQRLLTTIQDLEQKSQNQSTKEKVLMESIPGKGDCFNMRHSDSDGLDPSGELAMLRKSHDECLKDNTRLQKEYEDIRRNFEELICELENARLQNKEHEEMFQLQANMFKEDFLAEQKEKLMVLGRISDLEDHVQQLSDECENYERLERARGANCLDSISLQKETFVKQTYNGSSSTYPRMHRPLSPAKRPWGCIQLDGNIVERRQVTDGFPCETFPNGHSEQSAEHFSSEGDNTVVCPRCAMLFPSDRHSEFLDHYHRCKKINSYWTENSLW